MRKCALCDFGFFWFFYPQTFVTLSHILSVQVVGVKGRKFSPLHVTSLSIENRIGRTCFANRCRLRRSGVALQHVSAHFVVAK